MSQEFIKTSACTAYSRYCESMRFEKQALYPFRAGSGFEGTPEEWEAYNRKRIKRLMLLTPLLMGGAGALGGSLGPLLVRGGLRDMGIGALMGGGIGLLGGGGAGIAALSQELKHTTPEMWRKGFKVYQKQQQHKEWSKQQQQELLDMFNESLRGKKQKV